MENKLYWSVIVLLRIDELKMENRKVRDSTSELRHEDR